MPFRARRRTCLCAAGSRPPPAGRTFTAESGSLHPDVAQTWDKLGYVERLLGDCQEAVVAHERAIDDLELIFGAGDPRVAMALTNVGLAYSATGRPGCAREAQERDYSIFCATYGNDHPSRVLAARRLAVARARTAHSSPRARSPRQRRSG